MKKFLLSIVLFCFYTLVYSQTQNYVVLCSVSDTSNLYYKAANTLAEYRGGQVVTFNPNNVNALESVLRNLQADYVAVVLRPIELDINFVRRFLMMCTKIDDDPFSDFSYGYITGASGQDALDFVNNIINSEAQNIQNMPLRIGGYAASSLNFIFTSTSGWHNYLNPTLYQNMCMETNDNGTGHTYFLNNTAVLENKKLLDIGHNGDAHMLWLFEDGNMTTNPPVWDYDSTKIEDPAYARVGISSYDLVGLNLYPAVAFNGACHSGEPKRVMVEGDIAATFGDTHHETIFYTMSDTFSFALNMLKTGVTGYFAPCGANNANDQGEEVYNAFLYDEPLGDIHKRTIDGVVMGFLGNRPNLKLYTNGEVFWGCDVWPSGTFDPNDWSGACHMLGGKANRIYFGDPIYNPFAQHHPNELKIVTASIDSVAQGVIDIHLVMDKPNTYFPLWDKFHFSETRIYLPVELPASVGDIQSFAVIDSSGPNNMVIHAEEYFRGKHFLHIEVDIPDNMYGSIDYEITFRVGYLPNAIEENDFKEIVTAYPVPATDVLNFLIPNSLIGKYDYVEIINSSGQIVINKLIDNQSNLQIDLKPLQAGIYYWVLHSVGDNYQSGRFSIIK